jgi:hypothetical protein
LGGAPGARAQRLHRDAGSGEWRQADALRARSARNAAPETSRSGKAHGTRSTEVTPSGCAKRWKPARSEYKPEPPKTNWAKSSIERQDEQERKREAELLAAAVDKSWHLSVAQLRSHRLNSTINAGDRVPRSNTSHIVDYRHITRPVVSQWPRSTHQKGDVGSALDRCSVPPYALKACGFALSGIEG